MQKNQKGLRRKLFQNYTPNKRNRHLRGISAKQFRSTMKSTKKEFTLSYSKAVSMKNRDIPSSISDYYSQFCLEIGQ